MQQLAMALKHLVTRQRTMDTTVVSESIYAIQRSERRVILQQAESERARQRTADHLPSSTLGLGDLLGSRSYGGGQPVIT